MSDAKKKEPRYERFGSDGSDIKVDGKPLKGAKGKPAVTKPGAKK